jgi:hypothetical protein
VNGKWRRRSSAAVTRMIQAAAALNAFHHLPFTIYYSPLSPPDSNRRAFPR